MAQGKPQVFASRRLAYALDAISKNTALDILADLAAKELGIDSATHTPEEERRIAEHISAWHVPVAHVRRDKVLGLADRLTAFDTYSDRYRKLNQEAR